MVEVLEFIFRDIWTFLGCCVLLSIIAGGVNGIFTGEK